VQAAATPTCMHRPVQAQRPSCLEGWQEELWRVAQLSAGKAQAMNHWQVGQHKRQGGCCCCPTQLPDDAQDQGGVHWGCGVCGALVNGGLKACNNRGQGDSPAGEGEQGGEKGGKGAKGVNAPRSVEALP
jgi:hypothetical protein